MVNLVERFYSVQGEGRRLSPAIFVRTGLCNFKCTGFGCSLKAPDGTEVIGCDSIRAVSPKFKKKWESFATHEELIDNIDEVMPVFSKHNIIRPEIVLTGGEPLIYWNDDVYQRMISHYITQGHRVTIETNASLDIDFTRKYQEEITFSMSVKLSNSGEPEHKRINKETITRMVENTKDSYLKFVVSKETWHRDWEEIKSILKSIPVFVDVFLMPMGDTQDKIHEQCQFVMERCVEHGFWYSDRSHIRAWNDKEAV